jgi:hypothetical protein
LLILIAYQIDISPHEVRLSLSREEEEDLRLGRGTLTFGDISPSAWVANGLELEDQQ